MISPFQSAWLSIVPPVLSAFPVQSPSGVGYRATIGRHIGEVHVTVGDVTGIVEIVSQCPIC